MSSKLLTKLLLPEAAGRWSTPSGAKLVTRLSHELDPALRLLGHLETRTLRTRLTRWPVDRPIYVVGIARAGTTISLEVLHHHPAVATHRYYHLPLPQLPHWTSRLVESLPLDAVPAVERLHADRLKVTKSSPEAVEERLWTTYFAQLHTERESNVLTAATQNPGFERAYGDHLQKLCYSQGRPRYATKNNYLVTRLRYLHRLYPEARILLIIRNPVSHVASLHKQHRLFLKLCAEDPSLVLNMKIVGHYEFGPHQRFIHVGRPQVLQQIRAHWRAERFAQAWALFWSSVYGFLADELAASPALAAATRVVRYEDLCADSAATINRMLEHTELDPEPFAATRTHYADKLTLPDYYRHDFSDAEVNAIEDLTAEVASRFGY